MEHAIRVEASASGASGTVGGARTGSRHTSHLLITVGSPELRVGSVPPCSDLRTDPSPASLVFISGNRDGRMYRPTWAVGQNC